MNKIIIYTGPCPYCHSAMPIPADLQARNHPCPSCNKSPKAAKEQDVEGNWHITYVDTRNHRQPQGLEPRCVKLPKEWRHLNSAMIRKLIQAGLDKGV